MIYLASTYLIFSNLLAVLPDGRTFPLLFAMAKNPGAIRSQWPKNPHYFEGIKRVKMHEMYDNERHFTAGFVWMRKLQSHVHKHVCMNSPSDFFLVGCQANQRNTITHFPPCAHSTVVCEASWAHPVSQYVFVMPTNNFSELIFVHNFWILHTQKQTIDFPIKQNTK